jgi:nucleotide-binding universal stress UspA family protein
MATMPIIVGTDGSAQSLRAVEWAAREAVLRDTALRIVAVPALPPLMSRHQPEGTPDPVADAVIQTYERALATAAERAAELEPGLTAEGHLLSGPPAEALTQAAASGSMLVVGSRGAGSFAALLLGSASRYVATHASCPVVVAREENMAVHREIAVGIGDPGQLSDALRFAFEEASLRKAGLLVLHAWHWPMPGSGPLGTLTAAQRAIMHASLVSSDAAVRLEDMLASVRESYPEVQVSTEVAHAHPGRVLAEASARADLVVIGRRAAASGSGARSVTHALLSHAHGPVAVVPG